LALGPVMPVGVKLPSIKKLSVLRSMLAPELTMQGVDLQTLFLRGTLNKEALLKPAVRLSAEERRKARNMLIPDSILKMTKEQLMRCYAENRGVFRPGFFGADKPAIITKLNAWFGENNWQLGYLIEGKIVSREEVLRLYEDAYVEYFKANLNDLAWLLSEASDVYDNALSNVGRMDYNDQETPDSHYQDIAIRRAVQRLGQTFKGNRLIQVRGPRSEGYFLNPGFVPFHKPELIMQPQLAGWWKPNSIEAFYQSAKEIILISAALVSQSEQTIQSQSIDQSI
jgi:hypothetical protein